MASESTPQVVEYRSSIADETDQGAEEEKRIISITAIAAIFGARRGSIFAKIQGGGITVNLVIAAVISIETRNRIHLKYIHRFGYWA